MARGEITAAVNLEPDAIGWSIVVTARKTAQSTWSVYEHLRLGHYKARKSGRRTIVDPPSMIAYWKAIPFATFGVTPLPASLAPRKRHRERAINIA